MDARIVRYEIGKMAVKGGLGGTTRAGDLDLGVEGLQTLLLPEERYRAADLNKGEGDVAIAEEGLGFDKVGDVAVVVDATRVEARASPLPTQTTNQGKRSRLSCW